MGELRDTTIVCPILVGRVSELEAIHRLMGQAWSGSGKTVILAGEAGVGKSRLVAEAKTYAAQLSFYVLQGNCFEPDRALPYAPLLDLLHAFCAAHSPDEIARDLGSAAPELVKLLPELAALLPDLVPSPVLEPEQEKRRFFQALAQWLMRLASARPLLIAIEDLHWGDDVSLEFLLYLARRIESQPVLLLLTYRSDEQHANLAHFLADLDRGRLATELALPRLDADEVETMIRAIFEQPSKVRAEFVEAIHSLTDGNPFFVEESLKSLVAAGEIFYAQGTWTRKPLDELHIPRTVQDAVRRRTEQLSSAARQLLTLAAVAGRRFDFALLQQLTSYGETELLSLIKELMTAQLVVEASAEQFVFRHALTRQAVHSELLTRERQTLHRVMVEAMERVYKDSLETHLADTSASLSASLAYHAYEAEAWEKAMTYSQRAGEKAQSLYAPRAAVEHFTRALDAAGKMAVLPPLGLYRARGQAHELLGEFEAAHEDYVQALDAARAARDEASECQTLVDLGFLWTGRDYVYAGECFQNALKLAREIGDPAMLAHTLNRVGNWFMNVERPLEGQQYEEEALKIFQASDDRHGLAATLDLLGMTSFIGGDVLTGARYFSQASALFRELGDRRGLAASLSAYATRASNYLAETTVCAPASLAECLREGEEAIEIAHQIGWRSGEANALIYLGFALGPRGEYTRALACAQAALDISQEIEHPVMEATAHFTLGAVYLDLFALPAAQQHFEQSLKLSQATRWMFMYSGVSGFLASTYAAQHQLAKAESILNAAFPPETLPQTQWQRLAVCAHAELALARGDPTAALQFIERLAAAAPHAANESGVIPRLWHLCGQALAALGRMKEAQDVLEAGREVAHAQDKRPMLWRIQLSLGKVYQAQGRRKEAEAAFVAARALVEELAAHLADATLRDIFLKGANAWLPPPPTVTPRRAARREFGGLTERERQVAALIAEGKSNREIAEALVVSPRTVEVHIANIMSKRGYTSRAQIAAWAVEKGLTKI